MSVKALDLILKLTEELRGAKHTENSEGRAFYPESFSGPRVRSLNLAEQERKLQQVATSSATVAQPEDPPPAEPSATCPDVLVGVNHQPFRQPRHRLVFTLHAPCPGNQS